MIVPAVAVAPEEIVVVVTDPPVITVIVEPAVSAYVALGTVPLTLAPATAFAVAAKLT